MLHELGRLDPLICKAHSPDAQSEQAPVDFNPVAMLHLEYIAGVALLWKSTMRGSEPIVAICGGHGLEQEPSYGPPSRVIGRLINLLMPCECNS